MDSPSRSPLHPGDSAYMESESDIYVQSPPPYDDTINLAYSEGAELQGIHCYHVTLYTHELTKA